MSNQNQENERERSQNPQNSSQANNPNAQSGQQPQGNHNPQGASSSNPTAGNYQGSEAGSEERDLSGERNLTENNKPLNPSANSGFQDPTMGQRSSGPGAQNQSNMQGSASQQGSSQLNPQASNERSENLGSTRKSHGLDDDDKTDEV